MSYIIFCVKLLKYSQYLVSTADTDQSGTKPKLVAFLMATNFGHFLLFLLPKLVVF